MTTSSASENQTVAIIGASNKPERYAHKALIALNQAGWNTFPVHPTLDFIEGYPVVASIENLPTGLNTVTLYLRPERLSPLVPALCAIKPKRVIFNPGTESRAIEDQLNSADIEVLKACTLVLLATGQF